MKTLTNTEQKFDSTVSLLSSFPTCFKCIIVCMVHMSHCRGGKIGCLCADDFNVVKEICKYQLSLSLKAQDELSQTRISKHFSAETPFYHASGVDLFKQMKCCHGEAEMITWSPYKRKKIKTVMTDSSTSQTNKPGLTIMPVLDVNKVLLCFQTSVTKLPRNFRNDSSFCINSF